MIVRKIHTQPAAEPVSAADLRLHARLDDNGDDATLNALIKTARGKVEKITGHALITQTWKTTLDAWPAIDDDGKRRLRLSPLPVASITSITVDGVAVAASLYRGLGDTLEVSGEAADASTEDFTAAGIVITHVAGFGSAGTDVDADLLTAVKMTAAHFYENREGQELPPGVLPLLAPYQVLKGF